MWSTTDAQEMAGVKGLRKYAYHNVLKENPLPRVDSATLHNIERRGLISLDNLSWFKLPSISLPATLLRAKVATNDLSYTIGMEFSSPDEVERVAASLITACERESDKNAHYWVREYKTFEDALDDDCSRYKLPKKTLRLLVENKLRIDDMLNTDSSLDCTPFSLSGIVDGLQTLFRQARVWEAREQKIAGYRNQVVAAVKYYRDAGFSHISFVQRGRLFGNKPHAIQPDAPLTEAEKQAVIPVIASWIDSTLPQLELPFLQREDYVRGINALAKSR